MDVVARTDGEPMRLANVLRARVRVLDKDQTCELQALESILTGVALIASSIPACRAARTNVMGALRHE